MKNIFKYLTLLAGAALCAVACKIAPMDNSHVDPATDAETTPIPALAIEVDVTADDAATVTVTPDNPAAYISILVDEADESEADLIDPTKLYAGSYEAVAGKLVKYDSTSPAVVLELEDLKPNTVYQVYAITASPKGQLSVIANEEFLTTDTVNPKPTAAESEDNLVAVQFSENIFLDEEKLAGATAAYFAINSGAGALADVKVEVEGKVALFTVTLDGENPLPNGAYYIINYPAGLFVDSFGNPCAAMSSTAGFDSYGDWPKKGIGGRKDTVAFDLTDDDAESLTTLLDDDGYTFTIAEGVEYYGPAEETNVTMTVKHVNGGVSSETTYALEYGADWGEASETQLVLYKPAGMALDYGDQLILSISAGSVEDIYGNSNNAIGHSYLVSYNYSLDDITGTYSFTGASYYGASVDEPEVIIAPSDDEDYDLMVFDLFKSTTCLDDFVSYNAGHPYTPYPSTKFYADFDMDLGILTIYGDNIGEIENYQIPVHVAALGNGEGDSFSFSVPAAGEANLAESIYMYIIEMSKTWDMVIEGAFTRTSPDYVIPNPDPDPDPDPDPEPTAKSKSKLVKKNLEPVHGKLTLK